MARARSIRDLGRAEGHGECVSRLKQPGDFAIDYRGVPRAIVMLCPDGCGDILTVNLDRRSGKAWRTDERGGKLTIYPSIWRSEGCRAHFIVWRNRVLWCDWREGPAPDDTVLRDKVEGALRIHGAEFVHYEVVAEAIDENPWDVAWACRALASAGRAEVREYSFFRRLPGGGPPPPQSRERWA